MAFVDEVTVVATGGRGGDGCASFRREPYKPRGGPDGGNGGRGGSVILRAENGISDLSGLAARPHLGAEPGGPGSGNDRNGPNGTDLVMPVPVGTVVTDDDGVIADLAREGDEAVVASGGRGGRGNSALSGPKNKASRTAESGEVVPERRLALELRVVADVGLVGLPNAGKSTLLSKLTAAEPKVASYPFTTLSPNLGVSEGDRRFVVADIPGVIEGAHRGKGLGLGFLRHIARCKVLALVVDSSSEDPAADLETVCSEIRAYSAQLLERPLLIVAGKSDIGGFDPPQDLPAASMVSDSASFVRVSGKTGEGVDELRRLLHELLEGAGIPAASSRKVLRPGGREFTVTRDGSCFRVSGRGVERWVGATDFDDPRSVIDLQRRLNREGVEKALAAAGAKSGDDVMIGDREFEFFPEKEE